MPTVLLDLHSALEFATAARSLLERPERSLYTLWYREAGKFDGL